MVVKLVLEVQTKLVVVIINFKTLPKSTMIKIVASLMMLLAVSEAECDKQFTKKTTCSAPKSFKNLDSCQCECPQDAVCADYQDQADDCSCVDQACPPCVIPEGASATEEDYKQAAQPGCECTAADGEDPCDAMYGGEFTLGLDGAACPSSGGDEGGEGGEGGEGEESGAAHLAAAGLTVLTALLI